MVATIANNVRRAPIWPLIVAPFACFVYYILIRFAFLQSIEGALGKGADSASEELTNFVSQPLWGTHWVYRGIAEYLSITVAVFVAGGVARGRGFAGAVVGACAISLFYIMSLGLLFYDWKYLVARVIRTEGTVSSA
jgi:hypothetical protein